MDTATIIIDSCQVCASQLAPSAKSYGNCASSCDNAIWIVLIICGTILLLGLMWSILLYYLRKKQLKSRIKAKEKELEYAIALKEAELTARKEDEKKLYRSMLANFLELRAKGITVTDKDKKLVFDPKLCDQYINELKNLIIDLTPKQDSPED